mmetsp:Transcript_32141/g.54023  ORF Transcript_32141/g.54023 Transcript_32141/m.54023 type:complete len:202 (+) Transcript_32141:534-1139(+)
MMPWAWTLRQGGPCWQNWTTSTRSGRISSWMTVSGSSTRQRRTTMAMGPHWLALLEDASPPQCPRAALKSGTSATSRPPPPALRAQTPLIVSPALSTPQRSRKSRRQPKRQSRRSSAARPCQSQPKPHPQPLVFCLIGIPGHSPLPRHPLRMWRLGPPEGTPLLCIWGRCQWTSRTSSSSMLPSRSGLAIVVMGVMSGCFL